MPIPIPLKKASNINRPQLGMIDFPLFGVSGLSLTLIVAYFASCYGVLQKVLMSRKNIKLKN